MTTPLELWKAKKQGDAWIVQAEDGNTIATIKGTDNDSKYARLIASSPYMLDALKGVQEIIGDEDLPDNGEFSGAAISDMVRTAIELAKQ
jgi:hypothetical protein